MPFRRIDQVFQFPRIVYPVEKLFTTRFMLDEVMPASAAYRWTLNHTMRVDDPLELFPVHLTEAGI